MLATGFRTFVKRASQRTLSRSYHVRGLADPMGGGLADPMGGARPWNDEIMHSSSDGFIGKIMSRREDEYDRQVSVEYVQSDDGKYEYSAIVGFEHESDVPNHMRDEADASMLPTFMEDVAAMMTLRDLDTVDETSLRDVYSDVKDAGEDSGIKMGRLAFKIKSTECDEKSIGVYDPETDSYNIKKFYHTGV